MKKKIICGVLICFVSVALVSLTLYWRDYQVLPGQFVKEFIEISYNADGNTIQEVINKREEFYEKTYKAYVRQHPPIDIAYFIDSGQTMAMVSGIQIDMKRCKNGTIAAEALFQVKVTDYTYPEGFIMEILLRFDLVREKYGQYKISYIR